MKTIWDMFKHFRRHHQMNYLENHDGYSWYQCGCGHLFRVSVCWTRR